MRAAAGLAWHSECPHGSVTPASLAKQIGHLPGGTPGTGGGTGGGGASSSSRFGRPFPFFLPFFLLLLFIA